MSDLLITNQVQGNFIVWIVFWWYILFLSTLHYFSIFYSSFWGDINCFDLRHYWVIWLNLKIMCLVWISKYCTDQQKCYVQLLYKFKWLLKIWIFIKNHSKRDIQSQITLNVSRARYARVLGFISAFININIDFGDIEN